MAYDKKLHNNFVQVITSRIYSDIFISKKQLTTKYIEELNAFVNENQILKLQNEVNEVREIVVNNINLVLDRGEKIDELLIKSENLTDSSRIFLKHTKKLNSRCPCIIS